MLKAVVTPAVRGDYVVTPALLRGERPIEFFGKDPEYRIRPPPDVTAPAPATCSRSTRAGASSASVRTPRRLWQRLLWQRR